MLWDVTYGEGNHLRMVTLESKETSAAKVADRIYAGSCDEFWLPPQVKVFSVKRSVGQ